MSKTVQFPFWELQLGPLIHLFHSFSKYFYTLNSGIRICMWGPSRSYFTSFIQLNYKETLKQLWPLTIEKIKQSSKLRLDPSCMSWSSVVTLCCNPLQWFCKIKALSRWSKKTFVLEFIWQGHLHKNPLNHLGYFVGKNFFWEFSRRKGKFTKLSFNKNSFSSYPGR